jgi:hypothetical protein
MAPRKSNHAPEETRSAGGEEVRHSSDHGWRPVPDPTILTTQQLTRAIESVREILEARLDAMDKSVVLLQNTVDKSPTIAEIFAKHEEKFHSIEVQFRERDIRTEQSAKDSKVAVDAALQAAKEAVGEQNKSSALAIAKSETGTTKQIDAIISLITATTKGIDEKIDDIKDRFNKIENYQQAESGRAKGMGDTWGYIVGAIGLAIAVISSAISIIMFFKH